MPSSALHRAVQILALAAAAGCGGSDGGGSPAGADPLTAAERDEILAAQNVVRAEAQPVPDPALAPLTWSSAAASVAQDWANGCTYAHNGGRGALGENIAANAPAGSLSPAEVVDLWASEASDYDHGANACSGVCGHYTQLVWRATLRVGCGKATCPPASSPFGDGRAWDLWVCDYDPPGNVVGQRPY